MDERYAGDGTIHPSDHLLKLKELCELFKATRNNGYHLNNLVEAYWNTNNHTPVGKQDIHSGSTSIQALVHITQM